MSVREYIGARYVPVFSDPIQWDNTNSYEPLTVVMNEGTSYVSKQSVPAGIQITNETYWLRWADYNAQLEEYIRQVQTYTGEVDDINDALPIADFSSASTVSARFTALENALPLEDFDSENTVADRLETVENKFPIDVSDVESNVIYKPFDPMYYGADNTGTEDSSDAIDACIAANLGKTIVFTPGVYKVSRPIKTPYTDANRISIDFNGSIITYEGVNSQTAVLEIGTYEGDISALKTAGSNSNVKNYFSNFSISSTALCSSAVYIETHYMNACLENFAISTQTNGITIANPTETTSYPTDVFVSSGLIRGTYNNSSQIGININGSDNKFDYVRIYNFYTCVNIKRGGNSFNLIHTLGINANTQNGVSFVIDAALNDFSNIYNDTVATVFKITHNNYEHANQMVNIKDFSYNSSLANRTFIHLDGLDQPPKISVNNVMIDVNDNYTGFKVSNFSTNVSVLSRLIENVSFDNINFNKNVSDILNDSDLIRSAKNFSNAHYAITSNGYELEGTILFADKYKPANIIYTKYPNVVGMFAMSLSASDINLNKNAIIGTAINFGTTSISSLIDGTYAYRMFVSKNANENIDLMTDAKNSLSWIFLPKYIGNLVNGTSGTPQKTTE